jgi:hypothetical protein
VVKALADAGDAYAARRLAFRLALQNRFEEALALVQPQAEADPPDNWSVGCVNDCLAGLGRIDELQERAAHGDEYAELRLMAKQGRITEIRARADGGCGLGESFILPYLLDHDLIDDAVALLREYIVSDFDNGGDISSEEQLALLLAAHDRDDDLVAEVIAGNRYAGREMARRFERRGRHDLAESLRRNGLWPDGTLASPPGLLDER